jgi:hypothetical protein
MKRSLVFALILTLGHAPAALAGRSPRDADYASSSGKETLLQSGQRIAVRQLRADTTARKAQGQGTLAQSGMRTRNKFLIGLGIAAAFAGVALAIDGGVEDSTPSSRGGR